MTVLRNLLNSEKAIVCLALITAASVLTGLGHMSIASWREYTTWIAGIYVGGKSLQGAAASYANGVRVDVGELVERFAESLEKRRPKSDS